MSKDNLKRLGDQLVAPDVVACITISYHANGALSVSGNIGDKKLAVGMLEAALDSVRGQLKERDEIVVPNRDVVVEQHPAFPTIPAGDHTA